MVINIKLDKYTVEIFSQQKQVEVMIGPSVLALQSYAMQIRHTKKQIMYRLSIVIIYALNMIDHVDSLNYSPASF